MLSTFLKKANEDLPVYLTDVRAAFQRDGRRPFHLAVTLYDGSVRRFPLLLPETGSAEEKEFVASYVHAILYNILSSLGALRVTVYLDPADAELNALAGNLDAVFQTALPKTERTGYGKCLNVNERTLAALSGGRDRFEIQVQSIAEEPTGQEEPAPVSGEPVFASLPSMVAGRMILGMDIGGTDIKLASSVDGRLSVCKEFDWFPAAFTEAEQLIGPILLLTRLMRAACSLCASGKEDALDAAALGKHASFEEMERGCAAMEQVAGKDLRNFDAIGLCFPDVVIKNRIVGGETFKTRGMRENTALDYEAQFAKITALSDTLAAYTMEDGTVMNTNDGPMAAFTAAVEQAAAGADVSKGFFAHTLGTELGTGWVRPDGSIPEIPLEVYNFIIDLGSFAQKQYDANDVRSTTISTPCSPAPCKSTPANPACSAWLPSGCRRRIRRLGGKHWIWGFSSGRETGSWCLRSLRICGNPASNFLWPRQQNRRRRPARKSSGKSVSIWPSPGPRLTISCTLRPRTAPSLAVLSRIPPVSG